MLEQVLQHARELYEHTYIKVILGFICGMAAGMLLERWGHTKKENK